MSDDEQEQRTLVARARALAEKRVASEPARQLVVFERAGERYALEPSFVIEVARAPRPTPLPKTAAHWVGVTSLHGELMPVADLPRLLGSGGDVAAQEAPSEERDSLLVVLGEDQRELGIEVDAVLEPVSPPAQLARPPQAERASSLIEGTSDDGLRVVRGALLLRDPRLFLQATSTNEA